MSFSFSDSSPFPTNYDPQYGWWLAELQALKFRSHLQIYKKKHFSRRIVKQNSAFWKASSKALCSVMCVPRHDKLNQVRPSTFNPRLEDQGKQKLSCIAPKRIKPMLGSCPSFQCNDLGQAPKTRLDMLWPFFHTKRGWRSEVWKLCSAVLSTLFFCAATVQTCSVQFWFFPFFWFE